MGNSTKLKTLYYDEVTRLYYNEGWSDERISHHLPVGHTTVNRWVTEYAVARHTDKKSLRVKMGGTRDAEEEARDDETQKMARLLERKLVKARQQVTMLEQMLQLLRENGWVTEEKPATRRKKTGKRHETITTQSE